MPLPVLSDVSVTTKPEWVELSGPRLRQ